MSTWRRWASGRELHLWSIVVGFHIPTCSRALASSTVFSMCLESKKINHSLLHSRVCTSNWWCLQCRDATIRHRLTAALPQVDLDQVSNSATRARPAQLIRQLPPVGGQAPLTDHSLPPLFLVPDAEMFLPDIMSALQHMQRQVYLLSMPPQKHMAQLRSVEMLASLWCSAIRSKATSGPVVVAGIGTGGVIAHEIAVQLQRSGVQVRPQTLLVDSAMSATAGFWVHAVNIVSIQPTQSPCA